MQEITRPMRNACGRLATYTRMHKYDNTPMVDCTLQEEEEEAHLQTGRINNRADISSKDSLFLCT